MKSLQKYSAWIAAAVFSVVPTVVFAEATITTTALTIRSILGIVLDILNYGVIPLIIGLAFVVFLWGIFKYVTTASLDGKAGAKETIIYGLIGLFVMLAAWGLVNVLISTFFSSTTPGIVPPWVPAVPTP